MGETYGTYGRSEIYWAIWWGTSRKETASNIYTQLAQVIKFILKGVIVGLGVDYSGLDMEKWRGGVDEVIYIRVPQNMGSLLAS